MASFRVRVDGAVLSGLATTGHIAGFRRRPVWRRLIAAIVVGSFLATGASPISFVGSVAAAKPAPTLTAMSPGEGTKGTQLVITGTNLKRAAAPIVFMKKLGSPTKYYLGVVGVLDTQITARVKTVAGPGNYRLWVKYGTSFKLLAPSELTISSPSDVSLTPEVATKGSTVILNAGFLGMAVGTVQVGGKAATIVSWLGTTDSTPGSVAFRVPTLGNGPYSVRVGNAVGRTTVEWGLVVAGQAEPGGIELRLSNAAATSNTEILVQFNKAVDPRKAELPDHYRITSAHGAATVKVLSAEVERPDLTTVKLTTLPQSEITYTLKAVDIVDLSGRPIAGPSGPIPADPSATTFAGIGPSGGGESDCDGDNEPDAGPSDSDCDGMTDADEQRGYTIQIRSTDGSIATRGVTSDPDLEDTDGDGVGDGEEKHSGADPRSPDTDGDTLTDNQEWNIIFANPADQDTDRDGTQDGFEYWGLGTSPLLADTDGDQIDDSEEVFSRNRNPLVADLPAQTISVGDIRLQLDQRFTYFDETGHTVSSTETAESTLETDTSSTRTSGENLTLGGSVWLEGGLRDGTTGTEPFVRAHGEFNVEHTSEWSAESVQQTQKIYQQSLEKGSELSTTSSVSREVIGADISADVTIENKGNVAFSISSIEITVSERSPESTSRLIPVATLLANSALTTGDDVTFHLGPFNQTRGPVLFSSRDVFPNLIEQLMKNPESLVFTIANFDMTDELGRHFTYAEQIARDRTGGILIDAGEGNVERHLIATSLQADPDQIGGGDPEDFCNIPPDCWVGGFNANGSPIGIPLDFALQRTLGMTKNAADPDGIVVGASQAAHSKAIGDDVQRIPVGTTGLSVGSVIVSAGRNGVLDSTAIGGDIADVTTGYETEVLDGVETLVRVGSWRNGDLNRQWFVGSSEETPAGADFGKLVVMPGQDFYFVFVQDLDQDGLFARTELLAGSTDSTADDYYNISFGRIDPPVGSGGYVLRDPVAGNDTIADSKDTDRDGIGDFAEVRVGWKVAADEQLVQVFPSPRLPDSDGDGLLDPQEQDLREFCGPNDPRKDALCTFQSSPTVLHADAIGIIAGPNGAADSTRGGDDLYAVPSHSTGLRFGTLVIEPGPNGTIESFRSGDDQYVSAASIRRVPPASNPLLEDTDLDKLTDFEEVTGFKVGVSIRDGGAVCGGCRGTASTLAIGDDIQQARYLGPVFAGGIVVLPGPNGTIQSLPPGGDDYFDPGHIVVTDPLRRDTDSDLVTDGRERDMGGDPTNPFDAAEFKDSDQDGLSDSEESILGWFATGNTGSYFVLSNPSRPDSDHDGLPDLAERIISTDPNRADTDLEGLTDFDELADFTQFRGLEEGNPGFFVDGASSKQYGSDPHKADTDGDALNDKFELVTGYYMIVGSESQPRWIHTNPTLADTDRDGSSDSSERFHVDYVLAQGGNPNPPLAPTDATDADSDDDGRTDGVETNPFVNTDPLAKDISVTVTFGTLYLDEVPDSGGADGAEVGWWYTVVNPDHYRALVSDGWDGTYATTPGQPYALGTANFPACHDVSLDINDPDEPRHYTIPLDKSYTMRLIPGQSFKVEGLIAELDAASDDCGMAPTWIPSSVRSGCITRFSQTFAFNDFDSGGRANFPFPTGAGTAENCNWTQEIYVTSR